MIAIQKTSRDGQLIFHKKFKDTKDCAEYLVSNPEVIDTEDRETFDILFFDERG